MATRSGTSTLVAVAAATVGICAIAPAGQAQLPTCAPGTASPLYCQTIGVQKPQATTVRGTVLSANVCRARKRPLHISETISAAAGIRRVTVTLDGRRIKSQTSRHLSLTINTRGLKATVHTLRITVVDRAGRTTTRTMHFRICAASKIPKFTG